MMHAQDPVDLVVVWIRIFIDQVFCAHHYTGRAKATLQTVAGDKTIREGLTFELAETFQGEYPFAGNAFCGHCARYYGSAVDDYGAASALTCRTAAILGRYDSTAIAQ